MGAIDWNVIDNSGSGSNIKTNNSGIDWNTVDNVAVANPSPISSSNPKQSPLFQGSITGGLIQGLRDPIDALAQMLYHAEPKFMQSAGDSINNWLADKTGLVGKIPSGGIDQKIAQDEQAYQQARVTNDRSGFDASRTAGNVLATLPIGAGEIPATTSAQMLKGALQGGAMGVLQPVTQGNYADEKSKQLGWGSGLGGLLAPIAGYINNAVNNRETQANLLKAQNATRDATLQASQDAGYTVPRSLYDPTFMSNRLESLGGKAAIKQGAATNNQQVTNALAKDYLGVSQDTPLSSDLMDNLLNQSAQPYRDAASLPSTYRSGVNSEPMQSGNQLVEAIKTARDDARAAWKAFNSGNAQNPTQMRQTAQQADSLVNDLESQLDTLAVKNNRPDILNNLQAARQDIAKIHTIDKALNDADGNVSASNLLAQYNRNVPLTGQAKTIADFASAFPQVAQNGSKIPASGVSKSEALAAGLLATVGHAESGGMGLLAGGLPLLSHPARALALSRMMQTTPQYGSGSMSKLAEALIQYSPQAAAYTGDNLMP